MNKSQQRQAVQYVEDAIARHRSALATLEADLQVLKDDPPEPVTWSASVVSHWASEGEPSWQGALEALTVRQAVYQAMLAFCQKAGRIYPGKPKSSENSEVWDRFDVQGTIYLGLRLPNGTVVPVDGDRLQVLKTEFNRKGPLPKTERRRPIRGLT